MDTSPNSNMMTETSALPAICWLARARSATFSSGSAACRTRTDEEVVYYLRRTGRWPIGNDGGNLIASKRRLTRHAQKLTAPAS